MEIIRAVEGAKGPDGSVITLGVYDGVHLGHRKIISEVAAEAKKTGLPSAAVTFNPHPSHVLPGESAGLITGEEEKLQILEDCGLDFCVVLNFTGEFSRKSAEDFTGEIIAGFMGAKAVIVGFNHVFGAGRRGDASLLTELGAEHGFSLKLIEPVKIGGETVSSSKIREFIRAGDVERANLFLGRRFFVSGVVGRGDGEGAAMGFPTANIERPPGMLEPAPGVYAGTCFLENKSYPAVFYAGKKPTFGRPLKKPLTEIHIIGFSGDIYGRKIGFSFSRRLRPDMKFPDRETLKQKISIDIKTAEE